MAKDEESCASKIKDRITLSRGEKSLENQREGVIRIKGDGVELGQTQLETEILMGEGVIRTGRDTGTC